MRWKVVEKGLNLEGKGANNLHDVQIRTILLYYRLKGASKLFRKQTSRDLGETRFKVFDWLAMTLGDYPGKTPESEKASKKLAKFYLEEPRISDFIRRIEEEIKQENL